MTTAAAQGARLFVRWARVFGVEPKRTLGNLQELSVFARDLVRYKRQNHLPAFKAALRHLYPILDDRKRQAGETQGHYFHQDLWAARKIFARQPETHVDIGSRIDGFIAHLLVFMPVTLVDIRPIEDPITGLNFVCDDATTLTRFPDGSLASLSSLHAAEHFGLGRYGDPIDPLACFRFMGALARVLEPGGRLYFSVPVGRERVEFNAHRVFAIETVLDAFKALELCSFSIVGDDGLLRENVDPASVAQSEFACGLFEFTKHA
jgi:hypothetical protein